MIEIKQNVLQSITGGAIHPHLMISALGTIGVLASLYLLQKKGADLTQILCHLGCAASGGVNCICILGSSSSD